MSKTLKNKADSKESSSEHEKPYKKNLEKNRLITAEGWKRMMLKSAGKLK
jgi:hypothetical protein